MSKAMPRVTDFTATEARRAAAADLLAEPVLRWTCARKEAVVVMVSDGWLSEQDARRRYGISEEEFARWQALYATAGRRALRQYRNGSVSPTTALIQGVRHLASAQRAE